MKLFFLSVFYFVPLFPMDGFIYLVTNIMTPIEEWELWIPVPPLGSLSFDGPEDTSSPLPFELRLLNWSTLLYVYIPVLINKLWLWVTLLVIFIVESSRTLFREREKNPSVRVQLLKDVVSIKKGLQE